MLYLENIMYSVILGEKEGKWIYRFILSSEGDICKSFIISS